MLPMVNEDAPVQTCPLLFAETEPANICCCNSRRPTTESKPLLIELTVAHGPRPGADPSDPLHFSCGAATQRRYVAEKAATTYRARCFTQGSASGVDVGCTACGASAASGASGATVDWSTGSVSGTWTSMVAPTVSASASAVAKQEGQKAN